MKNNQISYFDRSERFHNHEHFLKVKTTQHRNFLLKLIIVNIHYPS